MTAFASCSISELLFSPLPSSLSSPFLLTCLPCLHLPSSFCLPIVSYPYHLFFFFFPNLASPCFLFHNELIPSSHSFIIYSRTTGWLTFSTSSCFLLPLASVLSSSYSLPLLAFFLPVYIQKIGPESVIALYCLCAWLQKKKRKKECE